MLDVHPPHEKIHGFRDFLLHLFTITVGLLIALGLEAAVEHIHQRHQREDAEATLQQEIRDNNAQLAAVHKSIAAEQANLIRAMEFLRAREANQPYDISGINLSITLVPLSDASWRTASATGVLTYMDYTHAQRYASVYHEQDQFAELEQQSLDAFLELHSYIVGNADPTKMTPEEAAAAMLDVRHAYAHLDAMDQIGAALGREYVQALAEK